MPTFKYCRSDRPKIIEAIETDIAKGVHRDQACKTWDITPQTFYLWKRKLGHRGNTLDSLEAEISRLKDIEEKFKSQTEAIRGYQQREIELYKQLEQLKNRNIELESNLKKGSNERVKQLESILSRILLGRELKNNQ